MAGGSNGGSLKRLEGRAALVTAAGQGMGQAVGLALAEEGARVAVTDINEANARRRATDIQARGLEAFGLRLDVTDPESVRTGVADA